MDNISKELLLAKLSEMIFDKHSKIDDASVLTDESRAFAQGYIEALYQVERMVINWGKDE
jgi:hypothetical protein